MLLYCYWATVVLRYSHIAVPFMVEKVTMTSRSRVPFCTDSMALPLPASSLTEMTVLLSPIVTTEVRM